MASLSRAASDLKKFARDLDRNIGKAEARTARAGLKEAKKQSSGRKTAAQMRKADHPYATRHGQPKWDASTINVGKGEFRRDWHIQGGGNTRNGVTIVNYNSVAKYLADGTRTMFQRPLEAKVILAMSKVREKNLDQAVNSAMK
jgi:hypothetical protein